MADKPIITIPEGQPPASLVIEDEVVGSGDEATVGKRVIVHYAGVAWSTGREFDASWNRGSTFDFRLGAREVIEGWDQGVKGMKVGGRRQLVIQILRGGCRIAPSCRGGHCRWISQEGTRGGIPGRGRLILARSH